jgi:hypothetical protein
LATADLAPVLVSCVLRAATQMMKAPTWSSDMSSCVANGGETAFCHCSTGVMELGSCVDGHAPRDVMVDEHGFTETAFNLAFWFLAWVDGKKLHDEIYEIGTATITNPFGRKPLRIKTRAKAKGRWLGPPLAGSGAQRRTRS